MKKNTSFFDAQTGRAINFGAGPAMLPLSVLHKAQAELLNWNNTGMSVMEMSHRDQYFLEVYQNIQNKLRILLSIPTHYHILLMQGGARGQFAAIPLNFITKGYQQEKATYLDTGYWSKAAIAEGKRYLNPVVIDQYNTLAKIQQYSDINTLAIDNDSLYLHLTPNETIDGVAIPGIPKALINTVPIIADLSSCILSEPIDVNQFGLIYAGIQKNLGPAGLTVVIIREDLVNDAPWCPSVLSYAQQLKNHSLYNTPPTFIWYMMELMLSWILDQGGVTVIASQNEEKASKLYKTIDKSSLFNNKVPHKWRSKMNIIFSTDHEDLDKLFIKEASLVGLTGLQGHRAVGGMRASLYNAVTIHQVNQLVEFIEYFETKFSQ